MQTEYRHDIGNGIAVEIISNGEGDEAILGYAFLKSDPLPDMDTARNRFSWILADLGIRDAPHPYIIPEVARADWQVEAVAALLADHLPAFN